MVQTSHPNTVATTQPSNPAASTYIPTRTTLTVPLNVGETVLSVERRDGMVITTTIKVEVDADLCSTYQPPPPVTIADGPVGSGYPTDDTSDSDESLVVVDTSAPPPPNPVRAGLPGVAMVPIPTELRRPDNDTPMTKQDVISRYVLRVPNARQKAFSNWDSALWHYAAAYQGVYPFREGAHSNTLGWNPHICQLSAVDNPLAASYTFGTGPRIGEVDVTGLDLDADRLPYDVDIVPFPNV
ncbi:hypothetical protein V5O48_013063 [Marasmius crinis-equi]|uniref:Uncharacterized protein n=1 Tax=Marasmius crinis-equi TaxID=585013 RepID=A0ABR3F139_9AGAR